MNITAQILREAFQQTQREILANQQAHETRWERMVEVLNDMNKIEQVTSLEEKLTMLSDELEETRKSIDKLRVQQIKESNLAPLAKALEYHHSQAMGWARLAATADLDVFPAFEELHREFQKMYRVVTQYEYVAQGLLGINPSPGADLEDEK